MDNAHLVHVWSVNDAPLSVNGRFEVAFAGVTVENPFDPDCALFTAYIIRPDGGLDTVPGFWYEGFVRRLQNGVERLSANGENQWRVRYCPRHPGHYQYHVELECPATNQSYRWPEKGQATFAAILQGEKGFLRVSGKDPLLFEYADGSPFFGIGHNLCGWEWGGSDNAAGTYDYDRWLGRLAANGGNLTQFHFGEGNQLEWTPCAGELPYSHLWGGLGAYNQQTAWAMDYRIQRAEDLGIFFRLGLFHWEDFDVEEDIFPDWSWTRNPYNIRNGRPAANVDGFFTLAACRLQVKKLLRYVVARWGASAKLLCYELWNEIDAPEVAWSAGSAYRDFAPAVVDWHREMAVYIKSLDPNHMLTTSFADWTLDDAVWALPQMDFSTIHRYTYFNPDYGDRQYDTERTLANMTAMRCSSTQKPVLLGEYALSPGGDIQKDKDPAGIEFHNQLWASLMSKTPGTAMHWTWGSYIDANDLYPHYRLLARFAAGEDLRGMEPFSNLDTNDAIQYMGVKREGKLLIWLKNANHRFDCAAREDTTPTAWAHMLEGIQDGAYQVEWTNLQTEEHASWQAKGEGGVLRLQTLPFAQDAAMKLTLWDDAPIWSSADIPVPRHSAKTEFCGDVLRIQASGAGIGGAQPECRFVYKPSGGDICLTVRLDSLSKTGQNARAGLALAADLAMSQVTALLADPYGDYFVVDRTIEDTTIEVHPLGRHDFCQWLRLAVTGGRLTAYLSPDGEQWEAVWTRPWTEGRWLTGMLVASGDDFRYAEAVFTLPAPPCNQTIMEPEDIDR